MVKRNRDVEMAARWGVFELAQFLGKLSIELEEVDVSTTIEKKWLREGFFILSYHASDPNTSFWIHVTPVRGRFLPISAIIKIHRQLRYYSFTYDERLDFRRIIRLRRQRDLWTTIILPDQSS